MSRAVRHVWSGVYALGFIAVLGFGATQAFGSHEPCVYSPEDGILGYCKSDSECSDLCVQETGYPGDCIDGCCVCA